MYTRKILASCQYQMGDEELWTSLWVAEITNCIKQLCKEKQLGWQMLTWAYFRAVSDFSY
ncbi:hypothetical protein T4A_8468 [Trichinella pseudospiralis]|uniref:Uncharacterized protein n=1 Tax=Trichinella pseudospiralis TaxID=6337 RepID=A0A0V1EUB3_TRIPS|nr:hypothetical protein T4A_8468 [Trichinella pseudospiralis]